MERCYLLIALCFMASLYYCAGENLDIPMVVDKPVYLTSHPCNPNATYITKLVHPAFEIHWLDYNPSFIMYPVADSHLPGNCFIVDFQSWHENGGKDRECEFRKNDFIGHYWMRCFDEITPFSPLKALQWSFKRTDTNITWSANFANGMSSIEIHFELISVDSNRTYHNPEGTGSRTIQLLKDSLKFSFILTNYTTQYESPESLMGDYYEFMISMAFLMGEPIKLFADVPLTTTKPALVPDRYINVLNGGPWVPYTVNDSNVYFHMQQDDGLFNVSLGLATFSISDPPTSSKLLAAELNRPDLLGFDPHSATTGDTIYYNNSVIGQTFLVGLTMTKNVSQSIFYDPNIGLLLSKKSVDGGDGDYSDGDGDGGTEIESSDETGLIVGLVVGLLGGAILIIVVALVVGYVVFKKQKQIKGKLRL